jgi:predicted RND superfamily exporter protein
MTKGDHPVVRARWVILVVFAALCSWLIPGVAHLRHDDDVLAFLPPDHEDVKAFHREARRFEMLEVVLVGLRAPDEDLLSLERVERVRTLAKQIEGLAGVRMVLSFTDLPDPKVTDEGLEVLPLVPEGMEDEAAIRERVLGSEDAVGNLISKDGDAAALLAYLIPVEGEERTEQRARVLGGIHDLTAQHWDGTVHIGGAPFIEHTAAESSRTDIQRLSPLVIGVLVVASALLLGSATAAGLNLIIAGLGVGLVVGAHGVFGEALSIVSSTIPVLMVALGGAFGVHMLAGYQRQQGSSRERASAALRELWLPVTLSGLTTSVAFFALLVMPQVPMRRFGVVAGFGVLLLLLLALFVLPSLLSILPGRLLRPRPRRELPLRFRPPVWALAVLALVGVTLGAGLRADPNTASHFDEGSAPRRADAFFNEHFGGSVFLQIAVAADLREPVVLREIRDVADELRRTPGIVDVRTLIEPVELLNEALGGRRGVPETPARASRVLTYLADHPAMVQLMTPERDGALIHIKVAPVDGPGQVEITSHVREVVASHLRTDTLRVGETAQSVVAAGQREDVRSRIERLVGRTMPADVFEEALGRTGAGDAALAEIRRLRDRALDSEDSPVENVPRQEIETIDPSALVRPRGEDLEALLRTHLPTLVASDPEGIHYVAEHLGPWVDEAIAKSRARDRCAALAGDDSGECDVIAVELSELDDTQWRVPVGVDAPLLREIPRILTLTGQPAVGQAFAESVTDSLRRSALVSLAALAVMLLLSRQIFALVPAAWTLTVTAGTIALLGHPISVGTSMVGCIALGAGVDFAIHLGVRARRLGGTGAGQRAVDEIGAVVLISALQLALAFSVLTASEMPPLRHFGVGLAVGLVGAALGAVWLTPLLLRGRARSE